jgi:site-specific DNA-cytosine methylase
LGPVIWQVEQDAWCRRVLARHWPEASRAVSDVTQAGRHNLEPVDLVCGGFPCQDVSGAGKGAGLAGSRSGLWFEFARIVGELQPRWVIVENVASGAKRWVDAVVAGLGQFGYEALPNPLSASDVGAPQRRARIFVVAQRMGHTNNVRYSAGGFCGSSKAQQRQAWCAVAGSSENVGLADSDSFDGPAWEDRDAREERAGRPELGRGRSALADSDSGRRESVRSGRLPDGHAALGHDADGRSGSPALGHALGARPQGRELCGLGGTDKGAARSASRPLGWPPVPDDPVGWEAWIAEGGPQPAVCRSPDGLPCGMARDEWKKRLGSLGNAVVPECAEVIGWLVRELMETADR